jgi:hypothetical protein
MILTLSPIVKQAVIILVSLDLPGRLHTSHSIEVSYLAAMLSCSSSFHESSSCNHERSLWSALHQTVPPSCLLLSVSCCQGQAWWLFNEWRLRNCHYKRCRKSAMVDFFLFETCWKKWNFWNITHGASPNKCCHIQLTTRPLANRPIKLI